MNCPDVIQEIKLAFEAMEARGITHEWKKAIRIVEKGERDQPYNEDKKRKICRQFYELDDDTK